MLKVFPQKWQRQDHPAKNFAEKQPDSKKIAEIVCANFNLPNESLALLAKKLHLTGGVLFSPSLINQLLHSLHR